MSSQKRSRGSSSGRSSEYDKLANQVTKSLEKAQDLRLSLARMIDLMGTAKDSPKLRKKLSGCLESTKEVVVHIQEELQAMEQLSSDKSLDRRERDLRHAREKKLLQTFHDFRRAFVEIMQQVRKRQQANRERQMQSAAAMYEVDEQRQALLDEQPVAEIEYEQVEDQLTFSHAVLVERHDVVHQMEMDMRDVQDMFVDLAFLVSEQDASIKTIESQVTITKDKAHEALDELKRAAEYQRKKRNKMCCTVLLIMIAVLTGIVLFFHFVMR